MRVAPRLLPLSLLLLSPALWLLQRLRRRPLRRVPRRALPRGAGRARRRVPHPAGVERRAPAVLVVPRELEVVALSGHADRDPADGGARVAPCAERAHHQTRLPSALRLCPS